jgi:hypothetical protein
MPAGSTYSTIATQTLGSNQATVTFSSIPGTYTDLVLVTSVLSSVEGQGIQIQFNGDTATSYSNTVLYGTGTDVGTARTSNNALANFGNGGSSTAPSTSVINFMNYSNSTTFKTVISISSAPSIYATSYVSLWRNTNAITSMILKIDGSATYNTGSTFTLYGISAA